MKIFEADFGQRPFAQVCLVFLALGGLGAGQQSAVPRLQQHGMLSVSIDGGIYKVRNARTGELLWTGAMGVASPGSMPKPAAGYEFQTLAVPAGATSSYAHGISSDAMQISGGYADSSENSYGLLFSNGQVQVLSYPGASQTNFEGINDEGAVVGDYGPNGSTAYGLRFGNDCELVCA